MLADVVRLLAKFTLTALEILLAALEVLESGSALRLRILERIRVERMCRRERVLAVG
jgi:hypothetical protein